MSTLSKRIQSLAESETLAMTRRSRELAAKGHDIVNLSIGQPDFFTPAFIKEAAKKAIDDNITYYPPVAGFKELRESIANKLKRDNNLNYDASQIVVSTGAKQSLANTVMSLIDPGDDVIVPIPYWVSYREIIRLAGGNAIFIKTSIENDFKVTPAELEASITDKTKLIIFSSPCNPTGSVYSREELKQLAHLFEKYPGLYIISDEIYELINFNSQHESIAQFESIKDRVILVNGVSKGFAMTGWRLGYLAANQNIAKATEKFQGQITSGASSISQMAAKAALDAIPENVREKDEMLKAFVRRRDLLIEGLNQIEGIKTNVPAGAFYIFPDVRALFNKTYKGKPIENSNQLSDFLLNEGHVATVPGTAFGDPNCIRISYATSEEQIKEALRRISQTVGKLQ
ncbi:MAG: pyridoxal phosphate-dependent aminotransferase [Bacteroidales bacterium]|nr:pyridoxal phosphate-dependent aminotransferase [Bacteroidales bacterium]